MREYRFQCFERAILNVLYFFAMLSVVNIVSCSREYETNAPQRTSEPSIDLTKKKIVSKFSNGQKILFRNVRVVHTTNHDDSTQNAVVCGEYKTLASSTSVPFYGNEYVVFIDGDGIFSDKIYKHQCGIEN